MVVLTEQVHIPAPFERLNAWVDSFEEEFVKWNSYNLAHWLLTGGISKGGRVRFQTGCP